MLQNIFVSYHIVSMICELYIEKITLKENKSNLEEIVHFYLYE